jgi:hypothetical protein
VIRSHQHDCGLGGASPTPADSIAGLSLNHRELTTLPLARQAPLGHGVWLMVLRPSTGGHTPVPPYQAFDWIHIGADPHVRPGQRLPMQDSDAHPAT